MKPNSSWAASDIMSGFQGGSHTSSTSTSPMPSTMEETACSTMPGMLPATGQPGVVNVIDMRASLASFKVTP